MNAVEYYWQSPQLITIPKTEAVDTVNFARWPLGLCLHGLWGPSNASVTPCHMAANEASSARNLHSRRLWISR